MRLSWNLPLWRRPLVAGLAECQQDDGYLGAYPSTVHERMKKGIEASS